ncbi:unnamed protein product [Rotaria sp. Silwood2]|nr:unnamed protein product [Rotaria sp. Silwood2]
MSSNKPKSYLLFRDAFLSCHKNLTKQNAYELLNVEWNKIKKDEELIQKQIEEYSTKQKLDSAKNTLLIWTNNYNINSCTQSDVVARDDCTLSSIPTTNTTSTANITTTTNTTTTTDTSTTIHPTKRVSCVAQEKVSNELAGVNERITALVQLKQTGLSTAENEKQLKILLKQKKSTSSQLKRLRNHAIAQKRLRRPSIDDTCPDLLATIEEIAILNGAADDRRRTETVRPCLTLDDLRETLKMKGYEIKRSTLYYRLLPRRALSHDGKKHVHTVNVRLQKAHNNLHSKHEDGHFAAAAIRFAKDLASLFGNDSVFFLSQDDKCKVPIGLPAAKKQAPLLMHLDYVIQLPDHDFVVAPRHQLTPSVYAARVINAAGDVGYSGPTYIAIRSAKHDKSISANHRDDFGRLVKLQEFKNVALDSSNKVKSIVIITVDGGPDENPRFSKTLASSIDIFKVHDLDALFVLAHAPGQSAFNAVERRMASLSHDLADLILPHDHFGTHLNANGSTIDFVLEKQNFQKAGEVLAEVWSNTVIDSYPVVASYVSSSFISQTSSYIDEHWCDRHVVQSQYTLQIVRCNSQDCCGEWRSNFYKIFTQRFLPPPVPLARSSFGLVIAANDFEPGIFYGSLFQRLQLNYFICEEIGCDSIPFDFFCTTIKNSLAKRTCKKCKKYFPTIERMKNHSKIHKLSKVVIDTQTLSNDEDDNEQNEPTPQSTNISSETNMTNICIIHDLAQWLKPTFEEI